MTSKDRATVRNETRIERTFCALRKQGRKGFIAYITAGDPSLPETEEIVERLAEAGVDIIELGIPFSDPLADGPVNQQAAERALRAGTTFDGVLKTVANLRRRLDVPIMCYTYLNLLFARGFERAVRMSARAGIDGYLLLDLPIEESAPYSAVLRRHHLNEICLVTPTSPDERIRRIVATATGFVYCVSRTGVTGMRDTLAVGASGLVRRINRHTALPVALGFGVSNEAQAREAVQAADAVVVGSAIVSRFHEAPHTSAGRAEVARWVRGMVRAVKEV